MSVLLSFANSRLGAVVTRLDPPSCTGDLADGVARPQESLDTSPKSLRQTMQVPDIER